MDPFEHQYADADFMTNAIKNDQNVWVALYDKYAPMIYGIAFNMTGDESAASRICTEIFLTVKQNELFPDTQDSLSQLLIRRTHELTITHLKRYGLVPQDLSPASEDYPVINALSFELATLEEPGSTSKTTKQEILKKLRVAFNQFRAAI